MLGIIIGVGSVITMLALGSGAREDIMSRMEAMGADLITISPGHRRFGGRTGGEYESLRVGDVAAIRENMPGIKRISPSVQENSTITYRAENTNSTVLGTAANYLQIRNFEINTGRMFSDQEVARRARVGVIGPETAGEFFDKPGEARGKKIRVGHVNIQVVGVLKSKGDMGWFNPDDQIVVPYTTAMHQMFGKNYLDGIDIQVEPARMHRVEAGINNLLKKRHLVYHQEELPFRVRNMAERVEAAAETAGTFSFLLGGIAAISLFVGGIGIMNIMLVTVTERTREIGVRKAVGARRRDILTQFLLESVLMSGLGGLGGLALGTGAVYMFDSYSDFNMVITTFSIILSLGFSAAVGIFFGFYPAWRAAQLHPIEALRYE
ncbi:MAG: ABC transporter permease [bacterium]